MSGVCGVEVGGFLIFGRSRAVDVGRAGVIEGSKGWAVIGDVGYGGTGKCRDGSLAHIQMKIAIVAARTAVVATSQHEQRWP